MSLLDAERDLVTVTTILVLRIRNLKMIESKSFDTMHPPIRESIIRSLQTQEANLDRWIDERAGMGGRPKLSKANVIVASRKDAKATRGRRRVHKRTKQATGC